ncbi:MAG TPA: hypothetical protein VJK03_00940 [Candidatus Nanoarchaeia archaeon]|nr:hypothetical protein [Candidatus Nanoarchaeia archaeon]
MTEERTPAQSALRFAFMTVTGIAVAFGLLGYARSVRDAFRDSLVQKAVTHYEEKAANADARENEFSLKKSALEKNEKSLEQIYRQQEQQLNQTRTNESAKLDKERRDIAQQRENILALRDNFNEKENKRAEEYKQREAKLREGLQQSFATKTNELYSLINSNLSAQYTRTSNELFAAWAKRQEEGRIEVEKVIESYNKQRDAIMGIYTSYPFALTNIATFADTSSLTPLERMLLCEKQFGTNTETLFAATNRIYDAAIEGKIHLTASIYGEQRQRRLALLAWNATNDALLAVHIYKQDEKIMQLQSTSTNHLPASVQDNTQAAVLHKQANEIIKKLGREEYNIRIRNFMMEQANKLKRLAETLTNTPSITTRSNTPMPYLTGVVTSSVPEHSLLFEKGQSISAIDYAKGELQTSHGPRITFRSDNRDIIAQHRKGAEQTLRDFKILYSRGPLPAEK